MSALPHDNEQVRVEADGAELEAPRNEAATAVREEGEQVTRAWTATDFDDTDWEHPDTRPRMRGWLHLFSGPAPGSRSRSTA
jgi:hemolysin III